MLLFLPSPPTVDSPLPITLSSNWQRWPLLVQAIEFPPGAAITRPPVVALELAMGNPVINLAGYFDTCRRKRNMVDYDSAHVVTETEATELLNEADRFRQLVEDWISQNFLQFS